MITKKTDFDYDYLYTITMNTHKHCESIYQLLSKNTRGRTDNKINRKWNDLAFYKSINYQKVMINFKNKRKYLKLQYF